MKIASVVFAGTFAWFSTSWFQNAEDYQDWGPQRTGIDQYLLPILVTIVTVVGLYFLIVKNKKRG